ncbi:E3 ubiquitin-protein ligase PUB23-like [Andrographis paniculata]|uniref:E3 ubiquitin-protein ligase PUB23-like n=1 Tax=Andrographis paniculata TaxID=175694 RepID=UPI0021E8D159|nr:E3 ubiquitin-protein ligase PUB23-like [Andrographis paniculata]
MKKLIITAAVMDGDDEIEIPTYFRCPISMELMKDPVTVATGITYDRHAIEKWLFSGRRTATCPVTNQVLSTTDLTPNHTLRRLIQAWCATNAVDRIPTPEPPVDAAHVRRILSQGMTSPRSELQCLRRLRSIAARNESSRKHLQIGGAAEFLAGVFARHRDGAAVVIDEALGILYRMDLPDSDLKKLIAAGGLFRSLTHVLEIGSSESRRQAIVLLNSALHVADPEHVIGCEPEMYKQVARIISDRVSVTVTKTALKVLLQLCPWGRNRITAVQNGAVWAVVEAILETGERRICELGLAVLDLLCGCAAGRAEILRHGAGLVVVSKKILRVSAEANYRAVRTLCWISRHAASPAVVSEMAAVGVAAKLCLVVHRAETGRRTREAAAEILKRHSSVWKESSCIPPHLLLSYPR